MLALRAGVYGLFGYDTISGALHYVADLHLHSKYSRAVSRDMVLPVMAAWARKKGIDILSTGDWTHPLWIREIRGQLEETSEGLYQLKSQITNHKSQTNSNNQNSNIQKEPLFLLSVEIASIYSQGGRLRRIHNLVLSPSIEVCEKVNKALVSRGCNISSDGRPIIGISSQNLLEMLLSIDRGIMLIPCHVWTPHFGVYGSASGFDSLDECFGELADYVYGIETGISSDPEMNWRMRELSNRSILSFSDAHSPAKMGRECTVFELEEPSYENIRMAIMRRKGKDRIAYTIEFYPEEGKYHFSGHRNCGVVFGPKEIQTLGEICPKCKKRLTEGVLLRVEQLASKPRFDRGKHITNHFSEKINSTGLKWLTDTSRNHPPYVKLVPLLEIVAESMHATVASSKVKIMYEELIKTFGTELEILLRKPFDAIERAFGKTLADGVRHVRAGNIVIDPGYDGEYGHVKIWANRKPEDKIVASKEKDVLQAQLF